MKRRLGARRDGSLFVEYDLRTSIQIAEAVASARPVWLEDPWRSLHES